MVAFTIDLRDGFENALVIVAGDHQPPKLVTHDNDSWAVPLHVVSRREELVAPFHKYGLRTGMVPRHPEELPMEDFLPAFLEAFDRKPGARDA